MSPARRTTQRTHARRLLLRNQVPVQKSCHERQMGTTGHRGSVQSRQPCEHQSTHHTTTNNQPMAHHPCQRRSGTPTHTIAPLSHTSILSTTLTLLAPPHPLPHGTAHQHCRPPQTTTAHDHDRRRFAIEPVHPRHVVPRILQRYTSHTLLGNCPERSPQQHSSQLVCASVCSVFVNQTCW